MNPYLTIEEAKEHIKNHPARGEPTNPHVHYCVKCHRFWRHNDGSYCVIYEYFECSKCRK